MKMSIEKIMSLVCLSLLLIACSSASDSDNKDELSANQVQELVNSGSWYVSSYVDSGDDETSNYADFTFEFNIDGTIVAEQAGDMYIGEWLVTDSGDSDSDSDSDGS
ncbi:MAG: hypothetical protein ACI86C_000999, partial [Candidatus Latescibacterota bacterium]